VADQVVLTSYGRSSGFCVDPIEKKPVGAENSVTSCDLPILVYQATEAVLS
jgi:hypothetical protein